MEIIVFSLIVILFVFFTFGRKVDLTTMTDQQIHNRSMLLLKKSNAVIEMKGSLDGYSSDAYKKIRAQSKQIDEEIERRGGNSAFNKRMLNEILKK